MGELAIDQLVSIAVDSAAAQVKTSNELARINELLGELAKQTPLLTRIVEILDERNDREKEALLIEKEAREVSGDAKIKLVDASTQERKAWNTWVRDQATRATVPLMGALGSALGVVILAAAAWLAGMFGRAP